MCKLNTYYPRAHTCASPTQWVGLTECGHTFSTEHVRVYVLLKSVDTNIKFVT